MPQNPPRGDPLANWGQENLAAPKLPQQRAYDLPPVTVYDEPGLGPASAFAPPAGHASHPHPSPQPPLAPAGGLASGRAPKALTAEEKTKCPLGDTRWPPAGTNIAKPLHLRLGDRGEKCIYYNLIYENDAPQVTYWKAETKSKATAAYAEKGLTSAPVSKEGKTKEQFKKEKEEAKQQESPRARTAIIHAKNTGVLHEISKGPRGTIWQLDEEHLHIWKCIEVVQKAASHKAVNMGTSHEKFEMFGVGLKGIKGDLLLVSQKIDPPE